MFFSKRMQQLKDRQAQLIAEGSVIREKAIHRNTTVKTAAHVVDKTAATAMRVGQFIYQHPFLIGIAGGFLAGFRPTAVTRLVRSSWSLFGLTRQLSNPIGMIGFLTSRLTKR